MRAISEHPTPKKERILEAALEICVSQGLEEVSMRRVAARVGITAPGIYRHYSSKQALIQAVIDEANRVLGRYLYQSLEKTGPWDRLLDAIHRIVSFAERETRLYDILFLSRGRTDMDRLPDELNSPNFVFWVDRVRECLEAGLLKPAPPVELAITIWAQFHGLISLHLSGRFGGDSQHFRRLVDRSLDQLFEGIRR